MVRLLSLSLHLSVPFPPRRSTVESALGKRAGANAYIKATINYLSRMHEWCRCCCGVVPGHTRPERLRARPLMIAIPYSAALLIDSVGRFESAGNQAQYAGNSTWGYTRTSFQPGSNLLLIKRIKIELKDILYLLGGGEGGEERHFDHNLPFRINRLSNQSFLKRFNDDKDISQTKLGSALCMSYI